MHRHTGASEEAPPLPSSRSSSSKNTHKSTTTPTAAILSSLDSSTSPPRPRHKSDSYSSKSKRSTIARIPVPTEATLTSRENSRERPFPSTSQLSASIPFHRPPSSPSASRQSSGHGSDGGGSQAFSTRMDLKRLMSKPAQSLSSLSNMSDSESSNKRSRKRPERAESSPSRVNVTTMPVMGPKDDESSKPRNVLRRKSSAKQSSIWSPSAPSIHRSLSKHHISSPIPLSPTRRSISSPRVISKPDSPGLTPAGAVAAAYKQQNKRREKLASMGDDSDGDDSTPYYTVFGSTSGKHIPVGEDDRWNLDLNSFDGQRSRSIVHSPVPESSGGSSLRKLSRKVSEKFKKPVTDEGVRPSLQERRSASVPHKHRRQKSLGVSIDGYVDVKPSELSASMSIPSVKNGGPATIWPPEDVASRSKKQDDASTGGKLWKLVKRISTGGLKDKYIAAQDSSPPPPVPALPKALQHLSKSRTPSRSQSAPQSPADDAKSTPHSPLARFVQGRSSFSGSARNTPVYASFRTTPGPPRPDPEAQKRPSTAGQRPNIASAPIQPGRPSTTTRSSSPNSSDFASSKFWSRTRSTRSSVSSYGEELPPVPKPSLQLNQPIVPTSELFRLEREAMSESPKSGRTRSTPHSPDDDSAVYSLHAPSRRHRHNNGTPFHSSSTSSTSPDEGSSPMPIVLPEFGNGPASSPPPRPPRSAKRVTSASATTPTMASHPPPVSSPNPDFGTFGVRSASRRSEVSSNASVLTAKPAPPPSPRRESSSDSSPPNSPLRSTLKFREMGSKNHTVAWTEKEKADRWDDLLEMSSKAGGTLHLGESGMGLLSDRVRLSAYEDLKAL